MFKIDFKDLNKVDFSEEMHTKVLRELCCEARQKHWKKFPDYVFSVNGDQLKYKPKKSAKEKVKLVLI